MKTVKLKLPTKISLFFYLFIIFSSLNVEAASSECRDLFKDSPKEMPPRSKVILREATLGVNNFAKLAKTVADYIRYQSAILPKGVQVHHEPTDAFDTLFWSQSTNTNSEVGVFEALDSKGKVIFRAKPFSSGHPAHIYSDDYLESFYSVLFLARHPNFSEQIAKIRMRHTHPSPANEPIVVARFFSPNDRRQALFFKATLESAELGHLDFESKIVFSADSHGIIPAKKSFVISASMTRQEGNYAIHPRHRHNPSLLVLNV